MSAVRRLARRLAQLGLPQIVWRLRRARRRPGRALVLMYHRVADEDDYEGLCVPAATFDRQLALLRQRMSVLSLRALVDRLQQPEPLDEDIAAITFDDGYRDNLDVALPILQRHGLSATVFVTTGFVDGTVRPTGERLRIACEALWQKRVPASAWRTSDAAIDRFVRAVLDAPGSRAALRALAEQLKRGPWDHMRGVLATLERRAGEPRGEVAAMLDWDSVRALSRQGIEIAGHTVSHPILSRMPLRDAERELADSKRRLETELGAAIVGFAFPNGRREDFTANHVSLLKQLGYRYACTAERGVNRPGRDLLRLRRIGVGRDSQALLDLKLALGGPSQPCAA